MSEEMAVPDNTSGDENNVSTKETADAAAITEAEDAAPQQLEEPLAPPLEEVPTSAADSPPPDVDPEEQGEPAAPIVVKQELKTEELDIPAEVIKVETDADIKTEDDELANDIKTFEEMAVDKDCKKGLKRRASAAFSDTADEDFKGFFDIKEEIKTQDYNRVLERLEAEVTAASKAYTPLRTVMATPPAPTRASKRARKDTGTGTRSSSRRVANRDVALAS